jgi:hypothetical protein
MLASVTVLFHLDRLLSHILNTQCVSRRDFVCNKDVTWAVFVVQFCCRLINLSKNSV